MDNKNFPKRLKNLRENLGITQKELANKLGVAESTIGCYEIGKRSPDYTILIKLSDILSCSIDHLLGHEQISSGVHHTKFPRDISPEVREYIIKLARSFQEEDEKKKER